MLEEGSFRGRTADFVYMFIFGCITTVVIIIHSSYSYNKIDTILSFSYRYVLGLSIYCFLDTL